MIALSCNNISLSFGENELLNDISFNIQDNDKVGIVGVNGAGKSTLFKILSGAISPDSGEIFLSKGCKMGYLEQNSGLNSENSIWEELLQTYSSLIDMESRLKYLEEKISKYTQNGHIDEIHSNDSTRNNEEIIASLMKEYDILLDKFSREDGYSYNSRMKGVIKGLGFNEDQFDTKIFTLSGGQKTRLALAKLLLEKPDILLLDEPTNHLDIAALEWLELFLKNYKGAIIVISHDRFFLDNITNRTIELENCTSKSYNGNYSSFIKQKSSDREIQQKHYEQQKKEIARMEEFIEQQKRWNREKNIVAAESRQKAIDRIQRIDKPKNLPGKIKIKFKAGVISGNDVLFIDKLTKEYPGKKLFTEISFDVQKNENVFILGPNGCGKSTLLKIVVGLIEQTSGSFEYGHNIKIGYYDQEQADIESNNSIIEEVWSSNDKLTQTEVRDALASFLFKGEDVFKPISVLSGGEKSRVALVKLMLSDSNLLILDEPTNHLDINSREVLEESLQNYDGTIISVSHDRYFINKLSTRILEFKNESIFDCKQNYAFYLNYNKNLKEDLKNNITPAKISSLKLERIASKEEKSKLRKLEKQITEIENKIQYSEARISEIEAEMQTEEISCDHFRLTQLHEEQINLSIELSKLYGTWEELSKERENAISDSN